MYANNPIMPIWPFLAKQNQKNITENLEQIFPNAQKYYKRISLGRCFYKTRPHKMSRIVTPTATFISASQQKKTSFKSF